MSAKTRVPPPPKPQQPVTAAGRASKAAAATKPAEAATVAPRRRRGLPIRLLPVTIFVAVLMLGMRLGDLWQGVMHGRVPDAGSPLQAQQASGRPPVAASSVRVAENPPAPVPPPPVPISGEADTGRPLALGKEQRVSQSDVELLQQLAQRRDDLERRAKELERREALLVAAEQRFDQKVDELQKLRQEIQSLLRTVDEKQAAQLESLVKIYESMKPKEAARIFEAMDLPVLLDVMERMKESKMAPILASMDPMKAKEVTIALVDRRQLPQLPSQ
ncbi:MAG TPA: hypothetical protein VEB64_06045 [Azospirillaceae bacterium]|nr:hypothetical protein [Azospirillaceae bacterium]